MGSEDKRLSKPTRALTTTLLPTLNLLHARFTHRLAQGLFSAAVDRFDNLQRQSFGSEAGHRTTSRTVLDLHKILFQ